MALHLLSLPSNTVLAKIFYYPVSALVSPFVVQCNFDHLHIYFEDTMIIIGSGYLMFEIIPSVLLNFMS